VDGENPPKGWPSPLETRKKVIAREGVRLSEIMGILETISPSQHPSICIGALDVCGNASSGGPSLTKTDYLEVTTNSDFSIRTLIWFAAENGIGE